MASSRLLGNSVGISTGLVKFYEFRFVTHVTNLTPNVEENYDKYYNNI